jgi:hypothetical protein
MADLIFPNEESELLYESGTPNDVLEKEGRWARLYLGAHGGSIIVKQFDGSVDHYVYTDDGVINSAWIAFEKSIEVRQPDFVNDHCIFPVNGHWAWTRPDPEPGDTCLITFYPDRVEAVQTMRSYFDELQEWWESHGGEWELIGPDDED